MADHVTCLVFFLLFLSQNIFPSGICLKQTRTALFVDLLCPFGTKQQKHLLSYHLSLYVSAEVPAAWTLIVGLLGGVCMWHQGCSTTPWKGEQKWKGTDFPSRLEFWCPSRCWLWHCSCRWAVIAIMISAGISQLRLYCRWLTPKPTEYVHNPGLTDPYKSFTDSRTCIPCPGCLNFCKFQTG